MSNQIRLKRGSGSNPSASDLVVGEVALRTDNGKLFTKKDDNSVTEIGSGISDGDKGDLTISNSGGTFTIDSNAVTSAKIVDNAISRPKIQNNAVNTDKIADSSITSAKILNDSIVNADINSSAAIAGSKIDPTFTSNTTIQNSNPKLFLTDTDNNSDYSVVNNGGVFRINDETNSLNRFSIASDGTTTVLQNLDVGAGIDVTGNITTTGSLTIQSQFPKIELIDTNNNDDFEIRNANGLFVIRDATNNVDRLSINSSGFTSITGSFFVSSDVTLTGNIAVSGTVDGVDIAARNTLFGGLTSSSGVLTNGVTATTQSAGDNSTKVATTAYTDTAISNLVDSSPSTLNTLNELAAALGDDANFSTTVTNNIATKLPLAGGTLTGNLTISNSAPQLSFTDTNANSDFQLKCNAGKFEIVDTTNSAERFRVNSDGHVDVVGNLDVGAGVDVTGNITVSGTVDGRDIASDGSKLDGIASGATNVTNTNQLTNGAGFLTSVVEGNIASNAVTNSKIANSSVTETKLANNAVTFAKLQDIAQNRIIGRTASGSGNPTTLTAANVRSMINVEDGATGDQTSTEIKTLLASDNLTSSHLAANCITGSELSNGSVTETIISNNAVTFVKMQDIGHSTIMGRAVGSSGGNPAALTAAQVRAIINVEDGATADQSASEIVSLVNNQTITPSSFTCSSACRINNRLGVGGPAQHANLCTRTSGTESIPTGGLIQNNVESHGLQVWNTSNSANYTGIMLETRTTGAAGWLIGCEHQSNFNGDIFFRGRNGGTSSFEAFRITSSKNCGIGDTSPDSTLCVKGTTHTNFQVKSGNSATKLFGQTIQGGEVRFGTSTNSHLDIYTNGTRRFRFENGGNLNYTLVNSNTIRFDQTTTANNRFQNFQYSRSGNGRGDVSQIQLGEGTSSEGRINIKTSPPNAGHSGGVFISNGGTSFGSLSDIRLKTKVADISNALTDIAKIDTWKYTWNSDTSSTVHLGITAQSVNEVYPEVVEQTNTMNNDPEDTTEYLAVLHQELIPVCIAAIKELKSKVEELQSEVAALKAA